MNCRLPFGFLSQFFQSLLHLSNQAKLRSTTHLLGIMANLCSSFRFATPTPAPISSFTDLAKFSPLYPPSTSTFLTDERSSLAAVSMTVAPSLSVTSAVVTHKACGSPLVSTAIWRLMPDTLFPASYPLFPAVSAFLTLWASTIKKLVFSFRPRLARMSPTDFF